MNGWELSRMIVEYNKNGMAVYNIFFKVDNSTVYQLLIVVARKFIHHNIDVYFTIYCRSFTISNM